MQVTERSLFTLEYRTTTKRLYYLAFLALVVAELIILQSTLSKESGDPAHYLAIRALIASAVPLSIWLRLFFFIRPRIFSMYRVYQDRLEVVFKGKVEQSIDYADIQSVQFSFFSPRFFGGYKIRLSSGQKLVFLSVLEGSHKILGKILEKRPELISLERYQHYRKQDRLVEMSWSRIKEKLRQWPHLLVKYLLLPVGVSAGLTFLEGNWRPQEGFLENYLYILPFVVFPIWLIAFLVNSIEEKLVLQKANYDEASDYVLRPKVFEKAINIVAQIIFYVLVVGCLVIYLKR